VKGKYSRRIILSFLFIWFTGPLFSQTTDYKRIFDNDWEKAEAFISENESWLKPVCERNNISYSFAAALIFPELVRYSALRDKIEISLLKTLYINLGEEYADFSIGPFQMKPSFAEQVHKKVRSLRDREIKNMFADITAFEDLKQYRASIVAALEDQKSQFNYLIAFIKICEFNHRKNWKDEIEKLKFFATAYNCGLDKSFDYIEVMSEKKFFSTRLVKAEVYSYSDISIYWYTLNSKTKPE
jgi:hypothetical protein